MYCLSIIVFFFFCGFLSGLRRRRLLGGERARQQERHKQPQRGGARDRRRVSARASRLRDRQVGVDHLFLDAHDLLRLQRRLVPGQQHTVQLLVGRTERQHHVIVDRLPDEHQARELGVFVRLGQATCSTDVSVRRIRC